jgi:hypothetical protein
MERSRMVVSRGSSGDEAVAELVLRLRPEIQRLLAEFEVPEREATEILREIVVLLSYRWDRVANREAWLLATLRRRCQRWRNERDGAAHSS